MELTAEETWICGCSDAGGLASCFSWSSRLLCPRSVYRRRFCDGSEVTTEDLKDEAVAIVPAGLLFVSHSRRSKVTIGHCSAHRTGGSRWKSLCCKYGLAKVVSPSISSLMSLPSSRAATRTSCVPHAFVIPIDAIVQWQPKAFARALRS
jgi:hypothetical protein